MISTIFVLGKRPNLFKWVCVCLITLGIGLFMLAVCHLLHIHSLTRSLSSTPSSLSFLTSVKCMWNASSYSDLSLSLSLPHCLTGWGRRQPQEGRAPRVLSVRAAAVAGLPVSGRHNRAVPGETRRWVHSSLGAHYTHAHLHTPAHMRTSMWSSKIYGCTHPILSTP